MSEVPTPKVRGPDAKVQSPGHGVDAKAFRGRRLGLRSRLQGVRYRRQGPSSPTPRLGSPMPWLLNPSRKVKDFITYGSMVRWITVTTRFRERSIFSKASGLRNGRDFLSALRIASKNALLCFILDVFTIRFYVDGEF